MTNRKSIMTAAVVLAAVWALAACSGGSENAALLKKLSGTSAAVEKALSTVTQQALDELTRVSGSPGGDFSYDLNSTQDGILIRKYSGERAVVVIPSTIEDYPVVSIGNNSFTGGYEWELLPYIRSQALTLGWSLSGTVDPTGGFGAETIVIPSGVTHIGYSAFRNCKKLHTVILPDTLKTIDGNAFDGAEELYNLVIPETLTSIEFGAGNSLRYETSGAFSGCGKLPIRTRQRLQELGYTGRF